jgi:protein-disulfide isomerase
MVGKAHDIIILTLMENLNKSAAVENQKKWYGTTWGKILLTLAAITLIFAGLFGYAVRQTYQNLDRQVSGIKTAVHDANLPAAGLVEGQNNYWLGAAKPKVTIVEFMDFACHYCGLSFPTIREIGEKYKKDVKIIIRDYPVNASYSVELSLAARCAGEQGLFWPMYDKLFLNQGVSDRAGLIELARQVGANTERFALCFDNKKYLAAVQKDFDDGQTLAIAGTPTWFINRYKIEGDIPHDTFIQIIDKLLGETGQN